MTRLVLVHGSRLSATQWAPQITRLAAVEGIEVVVPDLPGHGARAAEPFTLDRAVGAVAAAVEGEPVADHVILAGHSLGGYVVATYAATYPRRLDGLVLLGAAAVPRGAGAAAYRAVALLTERAGPDRMTRVNDRVLGRLRRTLPLRPGTTLEVSSVVGVARPGQLRRDFLAYVEREYRWPLVLERIESILAV